MTPAALVAAFLVLAGMYRRAIHRTEAAENDVTDEFLAELATIRTALLLPLPAPTPCAACGRTPGPLSLFTRAPKEA